jgi:uncharacterized membrane protein (DUF373 family)
MADSGGTGDGRRVKTPHTGVHRVSRRFLEPAQDVLIIGLGLVLFGLMVRTLVVLFVELLAPVLDVREVMAAVLFMLVMVELLRLLIVYLEEHRIAVDFMLELGIVSTLREIVLRGVVDLSWPQVLALSAFILALGTLLRYGDLRHDHASASGPPVRASETPIRASDGMSDVVPPRRS